MANISSVHDNDHENFLAALPFCCLNSSSFHAAMYELAHGSLHYDMKQLDSLLFNPITDQSCFGGLLDNLDPDKNFPFHCSSSYMAHDDINAIFKSKQDVVPSFSVLHINARSLLNKLADMKSLLVNMPHPFSAIGISETWLTDEMQYLVNISGYKFLSNHRTKKVGGEVGLYVQSDLEHRLLTNCMFSDPNLIESLFVEITVPNGKNVIIGIVYRPPNHNVELFMEKFNHILFNISKSNKDCYIMGDYNRLVSLE